MKGVLPEVGVDGAEELTEDRRESTSMRTTWSWAPMARPVIGLNEPEVGVMAREGGREEWEAAALLLLLLA